MWHEKIFYGKCYLAVVWQSSTYKIVRVIKLFIKLPQRILGDFLMKIIIYFYNYYNSSSFSFIIIIIITIIIIICIGILFFMTPSFPFTFVVPWCRLSMGQRGFYFRGPREWNGLPDNIKNTKDIDSFKQTLFNDIFHTK